MTGVCLKICLEGFQSGLSWLTILNKRRGFRAAFAQFDAEQVAAFDQRPMLSGWCGTPPSCATEADRSTINSAAACWSCAASLARWPATLWQYRPGAADRPAVLTLKAAHAHVHCGFRWPCPKDLKKRGWAL